MLLDQFGYRRFTPEECALLKHGAEVLVAFIEDLENTMHTGVEEFDRMEADEKLVALHTLCVRASSEEKPQNRELWLDATLMAVLTILESQVEVAFDVQGNTPNEDNRRDVEALSELVVRSYRAFHWHPEEALEVPPSERTELDESMLSIDHGEVQVTKVSEEILAAILEEYRTSWFYDLDFQTSEALDMEPEAYKAHITQLGIAAEYHRETAPSCPPQAVQDAQKFFSV